MSVYVKQKVRRIAELADDRQRELYRRMPSGHFLNNQDNMHHVLLWNTFFRRNLHRFAKDFLGINLHIYQSIILYMMSISQLCVIIACRAAAKSLVISVYAVCVCILRPYSEVVISSATRGQSALLVKDKIQKFLMNNYPMVNAEIESIKTSQDEVIIMFKSKSQIKVVTASENGRGNRSTVLIREEFRQINKYVDDSILSPFQVIRQAPYVTSGNYIDVPDAIDEPVDIYISSSWLDNGHWMWNLVDQAYKESFAGLNAILLAFDESIVLKHGIKSLSQLRKEKKKQDPLTWRIEFLNERVKENTSAYFTYSMLQQNQRLKKPFYPRNSVDVRVGKKNKFDIPKQKGEIRVISCDMAFIENKKNDNSIFTCGRLIPEYTRYRSGSDDIDKEINNGYRVMIPYLMSVQGGDTVRQALKIRQLYEDFCADYIVLDLRNAGISIYDMLANIMYDDERDIEYAPLTCMNDDNVANRIRFEGAEERIFVISASQKLNSDIAVNFRHYLVDKKIDLLIPFQDAQEEILSLIPEYTEAPSADDQIFFEAPFLETQALISETTELTYEKKEQTGVIVIREQGDNRKDRYTSVSYLCYFANKLAQDLSSKNEDYEYSVFVN